VRVELTSTDKVRTTTGTLNSRPCKHAMTSDNERNFNVFYNGYERTNNYGWLYGGDKKQDAGSPMLTSARQLLIEVTDENDCRPAFTADVYTVTVTENSSPGLSVFQLTAVDADQPGSPNSRLTYAIRPRNESERPAFAVDPVSNLIQFNSIRNRGRRCPHLSIQYIPLQVITDRVSRE